MITPNEVNDRHGTGVLVRRVFEGPSGILSIRARDDYGGEHDFGDWSLLLAHGDAPRAEVFRNALAGLEGRRATRIVCVPYCPDDLLTAIALHDAFGAPLATWIMDDQNVAVARIPDALMREALEKSRLRLTTHPEMRRAYEKKYGLRFWLLPAVAPAALVAREVKVPSGAAAREHTGALVGSIWSQRWLELLCATVGPAGYSIDWFGNDRSPYFEISRQALAEAHIVPRGIAPEPELAQALRGHPYAVVPTGTLEGDGGDARALAELSLPGRILFVAATSHTPLVVLGSERTPASRFVERFGIGVTVPYEPQAFRRAVEAVVQPAEQERMRRNAARIAPVLSSRGVREWVWESLEHGMPADLRFEDLLPRQEDDLVPFIEAPVPAAIYREYVPIYQVLRRLRGRGVRFDFVLDVGASMGIWSFAASHVFPEARFVLVDPLAPRYGTSALKHLAGAIPRHELLEVAVSNRVGRTVLNVPPDLFGASLLEPADFRSYQQVEVPVTTVDEIARQRRLGGRGMLKVDVQCAEHLVLEGAAGLLPSLDAVVLELSLVRYHPEARTFVEMVGLMEGLGFRYYDDAGCWRSPVDGTLLQKDVVFLRREVCPTRIGPAPSRG
ncbi:MAG TPA: FkbM family methyltransferase [Anaeromyxobacteraceae bacterium]|nr:FkbM family methyltransferase [Anaeromyxobacteraceae bacterium]